MRQAWTDLKSFVTIFLMIMLGVIIVFNLLGYRLDEQVLLLFTNIITGVITYYFTRKNKESNTDSKKEEI